MRLPSTYKTLSIVKSAIAIAAFLCIPAIAIADPEPPPGGGEVNDIPLDGGLSILLAAGVGYGAKKMNDSRKKSKKDQSV